MSAAISFFLIIALGAAPSAGTAGSDLEIVDARGEPIAGAAVEIWEPPSSSELLSLAAPALLDTESDEDGRVTGAIPQLEKLLIVVDAPGHPPVELEGRLPPHIELRDTPPWRGRLLFEGERLESGQICASWWSRFETWGAAHLYERCAELEGNGAFELAGLPAQKVRVLARSQGYLPLRRTLRPGPEVELRLERGIPVRGRVFASSGEPVAEVEVKSGEARSVTGNDGRFQIAVPDLPRDLEIRARGFAVERVRVRKPKTGEGSEELVIRLQPATQLQGRLLTAELEPPPSAEATAELRAGDARTSRQYSLELDDEGAFSLDLEKAGTYRFELRAPACRGELLPEVELSEGESFDLGTLVLESGSGLRARLVDAVNGEPIAGVGAELIPAGAGALTALLEHRIDRGVSHRNGELRLGGLDAGRYELRLRHRDYAFRAQIVGLGRDEIADLGEIWLGRGVTLVGRLIDRAGQPRRGLRLRFLAPGGESMLPLGEEVSGEGGRFEGPTLAAGQYRVEVWSERLLLVQEIDVPRGAEQFELELTVGGVALEGWVHRGGEPVSGGIVSLMPTLDPSDRRGKWVVEHSRYPGRRQGYGLSASQWSAEVDKAGHFFFAEAPAGRARLVYHGGGAEVVRRVRVPDLERASLSVDLVGLTLRGTLRDAELGHPVGGRVRILGRDSRDVATVHADDRGRFVVHDLEPGPYGFEARAEGYAVEAGELVLEADLPPLAISLERGKRGSLEAILRRTDGSPAAHAMTTLLSAGGALAAALPADAYGERRFRGLAAGTYYLSWSDPLTGAGASGPIEISSEEVTVREFQLQEGAMLELVCPFAGCAEENVEGLAVYTAEGADISHQLSGVIAGLRFSADGRLELGRLAPGRYLLYLWRGESVDEKSVEINGPGRVFLRIP